MAPRVTVLMPTYNRREVLPVALRSVLAQGLADWELLVINDGGEDVGDLITAAGDERIIYHHRPENRGKAACLNFGLERARGDYIAYLDDDDLWYPNHLAALVGALDERPDVGVAYSDLYAVVFLRGPDGRRYPLEKRITICRDFNRMLMFHFNHTLHVSLMHRRGLAERAGGYNEDVRVMIDWNLTRKLCFVTDFLHVPATTGEFYQAVCGSDRISDVQRRDPDAYARNLRLIRADLPPEPWPHVRRVAVVFPVQHWSDDARATVRYFADRLDYPCRIVVVNRDPRYERERCRAALGPLAELGNLSVIDLPGEPRRHRAYLAGAGAVEADLYLLAAAGLSGEVELRLIRGLCYMEEVGAALVRWAEDAPRAYNVLLSRELLLNHPRAHWPEPAVVPAGWLPPVLKADQLLRYARRCMADGNHRGAQQFLDELAGLGEGSTGKPYLVQLFAAAAYGLGEYGRAERMCRELIERGYGADNYVRLGRILQEQGRPEEALEAYARGLEGIGLAEEDIGSGAFPFACPMDYDAFSATAGRGECLLALGRREEAARALRRASRLRANSPRPYVAFGRLFLQQGQLGEAAEAFMLAARQERPARDVQVERGMAEVQELRGDPAGAFAWCRRGLARCPDDEALMEAAGRLGERIGRHEELARLYRGFLGHRPGHVGALTGLAGVLRRLGREAEAREMAERAALLRSAG